MESDSENSDNNDLRKTKTQPDVRVVQSTSTTPEAVTTRFHAALDAISQLSLSATECREAMLDCILSNRKLVAGCWHAVKNGNAAIDVGRLSGPVFERPEIRKWLSDVAVRATTEQKEILVDSRTVKNIKAICLPVVIDQRKVEHNHSVSANPPQLTLTLLATTNQDKDWQAELLAGQCVVRAYSAWMSLQLQKQASERLLITSSLLELGGAITAARDFKSACQLLTNSLQSHFNASIVGLGLLSRKGTTAKLVSISGLGDFDTHSSQAQKIEAAINEAIMREKLTTFPAMEMAGDHQTLAHKRAVESLGGEAVVTVPLRDSEDQMIGALLLCGTGRQLLPQQTLNVIQSCAVPVGSALVAARRIEGGLVRRTSRKLQRFFLGNTSLGWGLMAMLGMGVLMIPMPYRIHCRCEVEPVLRRFCLAPYDGLLENTYVQPGDTVVAGDLLAQMDGREIAWELAGVTAESAKAQKEMDTHLAEREVSKAIMAEMEARKLGTREKLLRHRRENLQIRSPLSGIVLSGSLDQRQNYPVTIGQTLYEVAPLNPLRLEVSVPAEEISHVKIGQQVDVRIDGETEVELIGKISSMRPQSESRHQQNVFVVEMEFENSDGRFRPGMVGTARISTDQHPLAWNLCHRAWEQLAKKFWW